MTRRWKAAIAAGRPSRSGDHGMAAGDSDTAQTTSKKPPFSTVPTSSAAIPLDHKLLEQEKLVEADPNSAALRNDFGNLLADRRFAEEARKASTTMAFKLDKKFFIAAYNLGPPRRDRRELGRGICAYRESIDRKPGFPMSHFRLGRLYERAVHRRGHRGIREGLSHRRLHARSAAKPPGGDSRCSIAVSLTNYDRDLASGRPVHRGPLGRRGTVFARTPVDRALDAAEAEGTPAPAPPGSAACSAPRSRARPRPDRAVRRCVIPGPASPARLDRRPPAPAPAAVPSPTPK